MANGFKFTPAQQKAIEDTGKNILVAASAGSGKTRVLVERVINKIKQGVSIDELLVVTFTEAAAKEMKERIQIALRKELSTADSEEEKRRYLTQLSKLNVANISTLHAFCLQIIKQYYYVINLDPMFRMLTEDTEVALLQENVWDDLREKWYSKKSPEFENLVINIIRGFKGDTEDSLTTISAEGESVMNIISTLSFLIESKNLNQINIDLAYRNHTNIGVTLNNKSTVFVSEERYIGELLQEHTYFERIAEIMEFAVDSVNDSNEIKLLVANEDCVGSSFLLQIICDNAVISEKQIRVVGAF